MPRGGHVKDALVTVRLTTAEVEELDTVAGDHISRSKVVRLLIQAYLEKPVAERKEFLAQRMLGG